MLNFQPDRIDESALRVNQAAIERHVDYDHYVCRFTPGDFSPDATAPAATVAMVDNVWPAVIYADGQTQYAAVSWDKPSEWRTGHLKTTLWYSGSVGDSTKSSRITLIIRAVKDGELLSSTTLLSSVALLAGPAAANTAVRAAVVYTTSTLGSDDELFTLRVLRDGTHADDNYTGGFYLLYVKVEHIPAQAVSE